MKKTTYCHTCGQPWLDGDDDNPLARAERLIARQRARETMHDRLAAAGRVIVTDAEYAEFVSICEDAGFKPGEFIDRAQLRERQKEQAEHAHDGGQPRLKVLRRPQSGESLANHRRYEGEVKAQRAAK